MRARDSTAMIKHSTSVVGALRLMAQKGTRTPVHILYREVFEAAPLNKTTLGSFFFLMQSS